MEIRDIVHGAIVVDPGELPVIDSPYFQRLRQIKQLGFAEFSFPSAVHNRYMHSLGAMETATQVFETVFAAESSIPSRLKKVSPRSVSEPCLALAGESPQGYQRFRAVLRMAALLHDIGHGPLSHTSEFAMPMVSTLSVPFLKDSKERQATHEDYTLKILLDSPLTAALEKVGESFGFKPVHVAALIDSDLSSSEIDDFFTEKLSGESINFQPLLSQIISSELDADRMDYLRRDSTCAGVSYGNFDFDWLAGNLSAHAVGGKAYLTLQHRALYSFEDFLISRYHMFLMVYFHYKSVVFDSMLGQYFSCSDCDYELPSDIEKYIEFTDFQLWAHLGQTKNEWAKRLSEKKPYKLLVELHSGIPATDMATDEQVKLLERMKGDLKEKNIHFLEATSTGELSKYASKKGDPIYVRYDNHFSDPNYIPLGECTDLFRRYSEKRSIKRLYVSPEHYPKYRD